MISKNEWSANEFSEMKKSLLKELHIENHTDMQKLLEKSQSNETLLKKLLEKIEKLEKANNHH